LTRKLSGSASAGDVLDQVGRVGELLAEALVGVLLRLVEHLLDRRHGLQLAEQGLPLLLGDGLAAAGALVAAGRAAQVDRDLDAVVPEVLHRLDLLAQQQAGPEQRQAQRHRHDHRDRHRQVPAQADAHFAHDQGGTHSSCFQG
jgi:hypothetical protein